MAPTLELDLLSEVIEMYSFCLKLLFLESTCRHKLGVSFKFNGALEAVNELVTTPAKAEVDDDDGTTIVDAVEAAKELVIAAVYEIQ